MNKIFLFFLFLISLILAGCSEQNCERPLALINGKCCVDLDDNKQCDIDEQKPAAEDNTEIETPAKEEPAVQIEPKSQITGDTAVNINQEMPKPAAPTPVSAPKETEEITEEQSAVIVESQESQSQTQKFLDRYKAMSKGYRYIYITLIHKINGDKIKIELSTPKKYPAMQINGKNYSSFYIDTIYLDARKLKAVGYCEKHATCYEEEIFDVPLQLNYAEFEEKTPHDWLYEYASLEPRSYEERKYYVKGRLTTRATYPITGGEIRIYYDPKIGLPIRIEKQVSPYPTEVIDYFDLVAELITPEDVIHRSKQDISPEDVFYTTRS